MRLKQIKLAGFKSFVDLTKVPFPHQMTAIVGPNGCGKSNIIDAVRWVLGESSAKHLRGSAMTDVIFNGAASRKPVGQASVELVFDNSVQHQRTLELSGLAERAEISVRRVVSRDGVNTYYLNGSKCRRRDITDIFLGTGLGHRSYAIIEQGMISRLIESKPQDLRVFIEEAAGTSQYKERRRETEVKLKHTKENLTRIEDLQHELTQQVEHLHIQAAAARKFKQYKSEQRQLKIQLLALQWQNYQQFVDELSQAIEQEDEALTALSREAVAENERLSLCQLSLDKLRQEQASVQEAHVSINQVLAQKEQTLIHSQQQLQFLASSIQDCQAQLTAAKSGLAQAECERKGGQTRLDESLFAAKQVDDTLFEQKKLLASLQQKIQETSLEIGQQDNRQQLLAQEVSNCERTLEYLVQRLAEACENEREFKKQLTQLAPPDSTEFIEDELRSRSNTLALEQESLHNSKAALDEVNERINQAFNSKQQLNTEISVLLSQVKLLEERLSPSIDWQQSSSYLAKDGKKTLSHHYWQVEEDWQHAVEQTFGHFLQSIVIDDAHKISSETRGNFAIANELTFNVEAGTLAEVIHSEVGIPTLFNHIFLAQSEQIAWQQLKSIAPYESLITKSGAWIGHGYCFNTPAQENNDLLKDNARLSGCQQSIAQLKEDSGQLDVLLEGLEKEKQQLLSTHSTLIAEIDRMQGQVQQLRAKQFAAQEQANFHQQQQRYLDQQIERAAVKIEETKSAQLTSQHNLVQAKEKAKALMVDDDLRCQLQSLQNEQSVLLGEIEHNEHLHRQHMLFAEKEKSQLVDNDREISQCQNKFELQLTQKQKFEQQKAELADIGSLTQQVESLKAERETYRLQLEQLTENIETNNASTYQLRQSLDKLRDEMERKKQKISDGKVKLEEFKVRTETVVEQLVDDASRVNQILVEIPAHLKESNCQSQIKTLEKKISRLGAINLAAIDEYELISSRKNDIDLQYDDLIQAVGTLESAISKIDNQTRQQFKATFEQVDADLQQLFPKVFGGGHAYLALTSDDMLESGVTIMAQPPGKKNATIHLLSGGEKALTALSLVFAIFRLNPAPFCMLDEVDAPLDDVNVSRFCNLVREMSQTVQFIFISHNKIAMEMASHLTGVTMFEPGVSKMVSVDIDEALAMAEVS